MSAVEVFEHAFYIGSYMSGILYGESAYPTPSSLASSDAGWRTMGRRRTRHVLRDDARAPSQDYTSALRPLLHGIQHRAPYARHDRCCDKRRLVRADAHHLRVADERRRRVYRDAGVRVVRDALFDIGSRAYIHE